MPKGWDPILLLAQIISLQSLHYLSLAITIPPLLSIFGSSTSLDFFGGPANIRMIMNWVEFGRGQVIIPIDVHAIYSGGTRLNAASPSQTSPLDLMDSSRPLIIAAGWILVSFADVYYVYLFVRKPRLILDFTLTLIFNHIILTTYYSAAFPTSLLFWLVMIACSAIIIIFAEKLTVQRELSQDFAPTAFVDDDPHPRTEHSEDTLELLPVETR